MNLYLLHDHMKKCLGCNRIEHWSCLYQPTAEGAGTKLIPVRGAILPPDSIVQRRLVRDESIPVCGQCIPSNIEYVERANAQAERWAETIRRKRGEALLPSEERRRRTTERETEAQRLARRQTKLEELA